MATHSLASRTRSRLSAYAHASRTPATAAALSLPLLVVYGLGSVLLPDARNGVDLLSSALAWLFAMAGTGGPLPYAAFYAVLALVDLGLLLYLERKGHFDRRVLLPLLAECALYAVLTGAVSSVLTRHVLEGVYGIAAVSPLATARSWNPVTGVVVSAGAGLHEEFIFRLVGIGGVARLVLGRDWRRGGLRLLAIVVASSLLFSAVHHIVEPFRFDVFTYRVFAGLLFAGLYLGRGFAVAAWTHALYDTWVIVVLGL